ncbi:MAG: peptidoglycan-binding domain-containing protein [Bdellovibrionales bacterium]
MKAVIHTVALLGLALGMITAVAMPSETWAKSGKTHHARANANHPAKKISPAKQAQTRLSNLGYYAGKIDGQIGPKTKAAIKAFQKDQGMKPTGVVNASLLATLSAADRSRAMASLPLTRKNGQSRYGDVFDLKDIINGIGATEEDNTPQKDYDATRPDFYGYYEQELSDVASSYDMTGDGLGGGTSHPLVSRFAKLDVIEGTDQGKRRYTVMLNERPILLAENQPTVIGISRTFRLGAEDAIIFSAYNGDGSACGFRHYLLSMRDGASQLLKIGNCTRGYQAHIANNSLFIVFPEADNGRLIGATWRYERGNVTRL